MQYACRMKIVIVLMLALVVAALAFAGVFMLRRRADGERRMARALAVRVGLSAAVFLLVLLAWGMGWITPTGLPGGG